MENPSSLEQNLNDLSRLMVDLNYTKNQVAIRGEWDMVAWLKNVKVRESQVVEILKEYNENTTDFFLKELHTKDVFYSNLIESLTAVKVLIEQGTAGSESIPVQLSSLEKNQLKLFPSEDLKKFTNFDKILGLGGYSTVYQGEFEGEQVAVKVLKENDVAYETFLTERITMGRIFHKNLVKLHGFCFDDDIKALVYEYMENGSLDKILYKNPNSVQWSELYSIALGIARGLAYLHHDCSEQILHHDVKAANVLLDKNLCPKITDFMVSNLMKNGATHITNIRIGGIHGYAAPEINRPIFPITCKCDVYSYGVMLFEILGRRCHITKDGIWFPLEVSEMWKKQPEKIMEYCGIMEEDREKAKIVLMVAMWCVQHTPPLRPSMSDVVEVLEKKMLVDPPPDPFLSHDPFGSSMLPKPSQQKIPVNDFSWLFDMQEYSRMDLEEFTSGFSDANIIGTGSYGYLYRGKLSNGVEVVIKLFAHDLDIGKEKFMSEGSIMSKVFHRNIVRTYGYCYEKNMIALVYEYLPRGSLDRILDDVIIEWGWVKLYYIVIAIASGLSYVHNRYDHKIIHLHIKPSNILFDSNLSPKIKNFGSAKSIVSDDVSHLSFRRTHGYAAPEVWMRRSEVPVTSKADVYSVGMIMFAVLGMRRNNQQSERWFPLQVWEKFESGEIEELIEVCGITGKSKAYAKRLSKIALWCIQYTPDKRPPMRDVVSMFESRIPIPPPPKPFPDFDDYKKREESESLLKLYEEKCPPGGENSVIIYTSTIQKTKRLFEESNDVRTILQSYQIKMIERDVWGDDVDYYDELNNVLGKIQIPVLFVKGRLIGAADEVKRLEAEGKLEILLFGIPTEDSEAKKSSQQMLGLFKEMCIIA